ncbi:MAG TPA: AAA-like domain-containing protein [Blastocatellia bacterium]|nr:AAA-like domain-containing protein [Blastocatellia bacterium]
MNLHTLENNFFVTGGTLRRDAACYVRRQADEELYRALLQGKFCYVLTSRQMGKSSLMVHTAARLREEGIGVAVLDLTAIGNNLTIEQWYGGLLSQVGQQLDLEDELLDFWAERSLLGPLQLWMRAMREIVLPRYLDRVVIFVDEIDAVHNLPFSTDEFFAGIRKFYNGRTEDAELEKLTFCLLGAASPSGLIRDTRTTPFNIGQRIELTDFTETEAAVLAQGLAREPEVGQALLKRVLHWTGGHPYLTQRLCQQVANDVTADEPSDVDRHCEKLFLSHRAVERDDNLIFVRERLLRSEADVGSVLDLYAQIQQGRRVNDDDTNPLVSILRLAGVTKVRHGVLRVRNRIYEHVFDRHWVTTNLPEAELERQRRAYRRGLLRAFAVSFIVIIAVLSLAFALYSIRQRKQAETLAQAERRNLYAAQLNLVGQAWEAGSVVRVQQLLRGHIPTNGHEDLRGFEWFYYWRLSNQKQRTLHQPDLVQGVAFAPDGKWLAVGLDNGSVRILDVVRQEEIHLLKGHTDRVFPVAFSPDSKIVASGSWDRTVRLWNVTTGLELKLLTGHEDKVYSLAFSPNGQLIASGDGKGTMHLWNAATGELIKSLRPQGNVVYSIAFSPDGKRLAAANYDNNIKIYDVASGQLLKALAHETQVLTVAYSPDNQFLATGCLDNSEAILWDARTGRRLKSFQGHHGTVWSIAFSPNGKTLATSGDDGVAKLWDVATGREIASLRGHGYLIATLAFSPDGTTLATGGWDKQVKLWPTTPQQDEEVIKGHNNWIRALAFAPDGKTLATASDDHTVKLWDAHRQQELQTLKGHTSKINCLAYAPNGRWIATGSDDNTVKIWEAQTGREVRSFSANRVQNVVFSPDSQRLAVAGFGAFGKVWDVATGQVVYDLKGFKEFIWSIAFGPDGRTMAVGGDFNTVKLYHTDTGRELSQLPTGNPSGRLLAFAPDGKTLAVEQGRINLALFDVTTQTELHLFKGHTSRLTAAVFSPDNNRIATGSADGTVKLWDPKTGLETATFRAKAGKIFAVAFAPDGQTLAVACQNRTVKLWRAASQQEVAQH